MSRELDDIFDNLKQGSAWLRILYTLGFAIALYVVGIIIAVVAVAQLLFNLFTGESNDNLRVLGASLSKYVNQILDFITHNSDTHPFPFAPFPSAEAANPEFVEPVVTEAAEKGSIEQKTVTKKASSKKPTAKKASTKKVSSKSKSVSGKPSPRNPAVKKPSATSVTSQVGIEKPTDGAIESPTVNDDDGQSSKTSDSTSPDDSKP